MSDERETEMLMLMRDCQQLLRQAQNTLNEIWAEWTRTHGLRGIPGKEKVPVEDATAAAYGGDLGPRKVKRTIRA